MTVGGSFAAGFAVGYFLRFSMKLLVLILGAFGLFLAMLANYGVITVNWDRLGDLIQACLEKANTFMQMCAQFGLPFLLGLILGVKAGARQLLARKQPPARPSFA